MHGLDELERRAAEAYELLGPALRRLPTRLQGRSAAGRQRAEYKQALALAEELGLRLDPRSVHDGRSLAA